MGARHSPRAFPPQPRAGIVQAEFLRTASSSVFAAGRRKQHAGALLGIGRRRWKASIPTISPYRRKWKKVSDEPKTLEEHLKRKRVDANLSIAQLARVLGVAKRSAEFWEVKKHLISPLLRPKVIEFLGYDPLKDAANPTRDRE